MKRLSFAEYSPDGSIKHGWKQPEMKDWADGISEGRHRAGEIIQNLRETGDNPVFSRVIKDAVKSGNSAALVGFLSGLAEALKGAAH